MTVKQCDACGKLENENNIMFPIRIDFDELDLCEETCYVVVLDTVNGLFRRLKQENIPA